MHLQSTNVQDKEGIQILEAGNGEFHPNGQFWKLGNPKERIWDPEKWKWEDSQKRQVTKDQVQRSKTDVKITILLLETLPNNFGAN